MELERRRRRAVDLLKQGESPAVVARILGVKRTSLHRWRRMARQTDGLTAKPPSGAKRRLDDAQLAELKQLLLKGHLLTVFPMNCGLLPEWPNSSNGIMLSSTTPNTFVDCSDAG